MAGFYENAGDADYLESLSAKEEADRATAAADAAEAAAATATDIAGVNVGTGTGVFKSKSGSNLQFKSILAGTNTIVTQEGDDIVVSSTLPTGVLGEWYVWNGNDLPETYEYTVSAGERVVADLENQAFEGSNPLFILPELPSEGTVVMIGACNDEGGGFDFRIQTNNARLNNLDVVGVGNDIYQHASTDRGGFYELTYFNFGTQWWITNSTYSHASLTFLGV